MAPRDPVKQIRVCVVREHKYCDFPKAGGFEQLEQFDAFSPIMRRVTDHDNGVVAGTVISQFPVTVCQIGYRVDPVATSGLQHHLYCVAQGGGSFNDQNWAVQIYVYRPGIR